MNLENKEFNKHIRLANEKFEHYPVVYILKNKKEAYIGESTKVISRM